MTVKHIHQFDAFNTPLEGTILIEADAGTGKTWSIETVYLRLIQEKGFTTDQILTVTFTEAATSELKDRIRRRLRETAEKTGSAPVKHALRDFDEAAIFTIHGFCKRMLNEFAFESGSLFDTELITDIQKLLSEIVEDFWRRYFCQAPPMVIHYCFKNGITPEKLTSFVKDMLAHPDLTMIPHADMLNVPYSNPDRFSQRTIGEDDLDKVVIGLKVRLVEYARTELRKRKQNANTQSFDDLLITLRNALMDPSTGGLLAAQIRSRYKAALIDEFQDTDPVQYAIFKTIFDVPGSILFLIGDPKQAIYSFRGADIFTYMEAARNAQKVYTLGVNWRSEPALIAAVNAVFSTEHPPFVFDAIGFHPARPADKPDRPYLTIDRALEPPMQIWVLPEPLSKTKAQPIIMDAVVSEISRLIDLGRMGRALIGDRPVQESDIAVLVRANHEASLIQSKLTERRIPAALHHISSLFETREAEEIARVIAAISHPVNERLIRSALVSDMFGVSGEELDALMREETEWERRVVRFKEYHEIWHHIGFIRMFKTLIVQEQILPRLMEFTDGERRCTNLLHLAEVLHGAVIEKKLTPSGLVKWLSDQRASKNARSEEYQLRLESDDNTVKVVTFHKSKGLEYPIVFCPFIWSKSEADKVMFHNDSSLIVDLGSDRIARHTLLANKELLAENLRMLYVALTRAINRCYLVWGKVDYAKTSAPVYLFHPTSYREDMVSELANAYKKLSVSRVTADLQAVADKAQGAIRIDRIPNSSPLFQGEKPNEEMKPIEDAFDCRKFSGRIVRDFHISSFSSLIFGSRHSEELADYDADTEQQKKDEEDEGQKTENGVLKAESEQTIFSFPKGAKTGLFLHDLLEHLDFTLTDASVWEHAVADKLSEYHYDPSWQNAIVQMLRNVISVPLGTAHDAFTLSQIRNEDRINELEFYFPLNPISPDALKTAFEQCGLMEPIQNFPEHMGRLIFSPVRGFMKGFMDMVFLRNGRYYLIDWKSNFLGARIEDYDQDAIAFEMKSNFYILQYHIYLVALNRYLKQRIRNYEWEKHFGEVYYLFLRGVSPEKGAEYGIWRDRPSEKAIETLTTVFCSNTRI